MEPREWNNILKPWREKLESGDRYEKRVIVKVIVLNLICLGYRNVGSRKEIL